MSTIQKRNRLQTAMKLTSTTNEAGFDAQRNRLRFFATSYSYSKHFIYAFNGRDHKKGNARPLENKNPLPCEEERDTLS